MSWQIVCFCGRAFKLHGDGGICPGCGELATIPTASQPRPATSGSDRPLGWDGDQA